MNEADCATAPAHRAKRLANRSTIAILQRIAALTRNKNASLPTRHFVLALPDLLGGREWRILDAIERNADAAQKRLTVAKRAGCTPDTNDRTSTAHDRSAAAQKLFIQSLVVPAGIEGAHDGVMATHGGGDGMRSPKSRAMSPASLRDSSVVTLDDCLAWLQSSVYAGYQVRVEAGWVGHRRGIIVNREQVHK